MAKSEAAAMRCFDEACAALADRLRTRFAEIEASLSGLVEGTSGSQGVNNPLYSDYLASLPANRTAILEHVVEVTEHGESRAADIPLTVRTAARLAARAGVPLDTLLRRYSAGHAFVIDILVEEAEAAEISSADLRRLLHRAATLFDHLVRAVSEEHAREYPNAFGNGAGRRRDHIQELLAGRQPSGDVDLDYDLSGHHIGLMARGDGADDAMRELAKQLDRRLLADQLEGEPAWSCWLGCRSKLGTEEALRQLQGALPDSITVTLGEPGEGVTGWRLSHRQAKAALPLAEARGEQILRYADVAVLASIMRDDLGATSLREIYIEPLKASQDGGKAWIDTLRAYFANERNISSTAAALEVDRRTVRNRLHAVERLFERPLKDFATDLETALRLVD
jgi:hypothetical protein